MLAQRQLSVRASAAKAPKAAKQAKVAPRANSYPEWGASPYDDPTFTWAAENSPWGSWDTMEQETKVRWQQFELMHGRWAMLGCAGAWAGEVGTGIPWFQAGKVCTPADCTAVNTIFPGQVIPVAPVAGFPSFYLVAGFTLIAMGLAEGYRTGLLENPFPELTVGDLHPGGEHFDPLGFADTLGLDNAKLAEIKHARLAMFSWFGYYSQALTTNEGAYTGSLPSYTEGAAGPYANWQAHVADPLTNNVWMYFGF